ncbi:MAG: proline dehydrogenase [Bacteroidetes bacterium]|nr:MAG: proline dehydrogenase [Bacteroidota bacterium]
MSLSRTALLWVSQNQTLRQTLPKYKFIRRAVSKFMPGEELDDALNAAEQLKAQAVNTIVTHLGENIAEEAEAKRVAEHYCDTLKQISERTIDTYVSVKLTQLGLDLSEQLCMNTLSRIVGDAKLYGNMVWIDIEQSQYVDRTLAVFKNIKQSYSNVGICLQSYLYRTENDLKELLPLSPAIRLVKGAYKEPATLAFPRKVDNDANYFKLSKIMLENVRTNGVYAGIATHDTILHKRIIEEADRLQLEKTDFEFQMLYGINMEEQLRLAREGYKVRDLISYGTFWFPWYVRRLAERPANVWFVVKNMFNFRI